METIQFEDLTYEHLFALNNQRVKIMKDGIDFYILLRLKQGNDKLIVHSNGAVNKKKVALPAFTRTDWYKDIDASFVYMDDRTLHDGNVNLAWGLGTKSRHYLRDYHDIAARIAELIDVETENVTYLGSSGGGFISMMLATMHKGARAIVNNPQTYVHRYKKLAVDRAYQHVFGDMPAQEIQRRYSTRLSLTALMRHENHVPEIFYIQNRLGQVDMEDHYTPFNQMLDKYKLDSKKIKYILYSDAEAGHQPIPKDRFIAFINAVIDQKLAIY
ncbi:glycosyl transferase [Staphylococcus massiliensis]|uniref:glycosyl transferase n=1 Tax=Staphylococcus massiliensis TaxID=555791 RepID=UPI001EE00E87|nr:glycosyl transferase [Staphylococcus massiliensis]MCG3402116.1 glycosyl transferase [Staphylococcus massiliensis]MCG3413314.1 glycosyl transferase [Staphylococcus massiliensis]